MTNIVTNFAMTAVPAGFPTVLPSVPGVAQINAPVIAMDPQRPPGGDAYVSGGTAFAGSLVRGQPKVMRGLSLLVPEARVALESHGPRNALLYRVFSEYLKLKETLLKLWATVRNSPLDDYYKAALRTPSVGPDRIPLTHSVVEAVVCAIAGVKGISKKDVRIVVAGHGGQLLEVDIWAATGASVIAVETDNDAVQRLKEWMSQTRMSLPNVTVLNAGVVAKGDVVVWTHPREERDDLTLKNNDLIRYMDEGLGILIVQTDEMRLGGFADDPMKLAETRPFLYHRLLHSRIDKNSYLIPSIHADFGDLHIFFKTPADTSPRAVLLELSRQGLWEIENGWTRRSGGETPLHEPMQMAAMAFAGRAPIESLSDGLRHTVTAFMDGEVGRINQAFLHRPSWEAGGPRHWWHEMGVLQRNYIEAILSEAVYKRIQVAASIEELRQAIETARWWHPDIERAGEALDEPARLTRYFGIRQKYFEIRESQAEEGSKRDRVDASVIAITTGYLGAREVRSRADARRIIRKFVEEEGVRQLERVLTVMDPGERALFWDEYFGEGAERVLNGSRVFWVARAMGLEGIPRSAYVLEGFDEGGRKIWVIKRGEVKDGLEDDVDDGFRYRVVAGVHMEE